MNLTPAEQWSKLLSVCRFDEQPNIVRQIQADALRFAAEIIEDFGQERRLAIHKLRHDADQLHPKS